MKIEEVKKLSPKERFIYWIKERELIRHKKENGYSWPWTEDEILQTYRFCNVRRMDDKVSKWLFTNWYAPNYNHKNMLLACALARFINLPESLEVLGFPKRWSPKNIIRKLRNYRDQGNKVFNGAYMVRGNDGIDKIECVVNHYVAPLSKLKINTVSCWDTWETINSSYGFGSFMSGQVTADLRHAVDGDWVDAGNFWPKGPGSMRGLNRLFDRHLSIQLSQHKFSEEMNKVNSICQANLPKFVYERLEGIDIQNCLCEFDKYERTLFDGRRPKAIYRR